jgi:hypothetical protein
MSNEELILERLSKIEEKMGGMCKSWEELAEFKQDAALLMNPAIRILTEELIEVESGFQLEDVFPLMKRTLRSLKNLTYALEQLENLIELWQNLEPLLKVAVPNLVRYLDELERQGVFRILKKMLTVEMLQFVDKLLDLPVDLHLEECKPCGPIGMLSGLRSDEGKQALGVILELTKALSKFRTEPVQVS